MKGYFVFLFFTCLILFSCTNFNKSRYNFSNDLLYRKHKGICLHIDSLSDSIQKVMVKWDNNWMSIGDVEDGKLVRIWKTYDKKMNLRSEKYFGIDCIYYFVLFDKNGGIKYKSKLSANCF